jgi:hypothetical protein
MAEAAGAFDRPGQSFRRMMVLRQSAPPRWLRSATNTARPLQGSRPRPRLRRGRSGFRRQAESDRAAAAEGRAKAGEAAVLARAGEEAAALIGAKSVESVRIADEPKDHRRAEDGEKPARSDVHLGWCAPAASLDVVLPEHSPDHGDHEAGREQRVCPFGRECLLAGVHDPHPLERRGGNHGGERFGAAMGYDAELGSRLGAHAPGGHHARGRPVRHPAPGLLNRHGGH